MNENETNLPESQLRSWQPRRPSAGLERRIFPRRPERSAAAWFLGSLAPVAACAVLSLVIMNSGSGFPSRAGSRSPMVAMILSNQDYAAYMAERSQSEQNRWSKVIFDSTNDGISTSSIRFTPTTKPNE